MSDVELPADLLERPADEAARRIAWTFVDDAHEAIERLGRGDDEALHDLRVALRRLRSLARSHSRHLGAALDAKRRKGLARLQRATGGARDSEVQLYWVRRLRKKLPHRERRALRPLMTRLDSDVRRAMRGVSSKARAQFGKLEPKLRKRLETVTRHWREPVERYGRVAGGLMRDHTSALVSLLEPLGSIEQVRELHDARIAGKRLRYLLEPLRSHAADAPALVERLKSLQDLLGDIHDMQVLEKTLAAKVEKAKGKERDALLALSEQARLHALRCFQTQQREFAGEALAELVASAEAVARTLEVSGPSEVEIERKYLLASLPDEVRSHEAVEIAQGYLPGTDIRERLRRVTGAHGTRYLRTLKAGRGIARIEVEEETSAPVFEAMWPLTEGSRVLKRRYTVPDGKLRWEIDEFLDRPLVLAEVELPSADLLPELPRWLRPHLVREVTGEDTYVNVNLAN